MLQSTQVKSAHYLFAWSTQDFRGPGPFVHSLVLSDLATAGCIQNFQKSVPNNLGLEIRNQGIRHLEYVGLKVPSQHCKELLMEAARNWLCRAALKDCPSLPCSLLINFSASVLNKMKSHG